MRLHLLALLWNCVEFSISQDSPLVRVSGEHKINKNSDEDYTNTFKRREIVANADAAMRWNHRRATTSSSDIIFAPLKDHRIITKERLGTPYENIYEQLSNQQPTANALDPIYVTQPPARTTIAVRFELLESKTDVLVNGGRGEGLEPSISTVKPRQTTNLKLVTLSPAFTTPLPPFKYTRSVVNMGNNGNILFRHPATIDQTPTSLVRFPAQPWQIPPRDPLQNQPNIFSRFFEVTPQPGVPPPNPFANLLSLPQPGMNNPLNLTVFPFIPIGTSNPPWTPPGAIKPQSPYGYVNREIDPQMIHKSPLRVDFAKTRELPLPPRPHGNEELSFVPEMERNKEEYSIDFKPQVDQVDYRQPYIPYKPSAKTFVTEKKTRIPTQIGKSDQLGTVHPSTTGESLREYMRVHPNAVNSLSKAPQPAKMHATLTPQPQTGAPYHNVSKPSSAPNNMPQQVLLPVGAIVGGPSMSSMAGMSTSGFNPNQKLDLCCRKQQVTASCQSLCNFDSFNDKTLVSAFLTNQCPGPQLGKAYDCASSKADHTACCQAGGLHTFLGGRCMPFCQTHQATPANVLEYISCLQVFETIKNCYRQYQYSNKNIFGD